MTDIIDELRDLNLRMMEKHQEEVFRVDQAAVRVAQHGANRNRTLAAIRDQQRHDLAETRRLLHEIAADAGLLPAQPETHQALPSVQDEPFVAPRYLQDHDGFKNLEDVVLQ